MELIQKAIALKDELDQFRPLSKAEELRIMQKFRLDWNYHSNHLEGNSLTYGETKALLLFGITAKAKPLKDHFEITGHNEAVEWVLDIVKQERPLTEAFIRELHTLLLKKPYQSKAITPAGQATTKTVKVGEYKSTPNHVLTATGEIFHFATPEETPAKMQELLRWYREDTKDRDPILIAAEFHYRFIRIHPFDDGNGRTARILMNFILMKHAYPPVIIKTEDKENYFAALQQADAGMIEPFVAYIAQNLIHSLEIMIRGAQGEDIEEPDDFDKELALLDQKLKVVGGKEIKLTRNRQTIADFYNQSLCPLFQELKNQGSKFERFYQDASFVITVDGKQWKLAKEMSPHQIGNMIRVECKYKFDALKQIHLNLFHYEMHVYIDFLLEKILIKRDTLNQLQGNHIIEKLYNEVLAEDEISQFVKGALKDHKQVLELEIEKIAKGS